MVAAISTLTLESAQPLLALASNSVRLLHSHYTKGHEKALATGDEDAESEHVENLIDVEITLRELDPVYWKELADKRLQPGTSAPYWNVFDQLKPATVGSFTSWSSEELARRADTKARITALLGLGSTPKAFWVVPEAVKHWREARVASLAKDNESEDVQLDLLVFFERKAREGWVV